jgi:hypothetical protein
MAKEAFRAIHLRQMAADTSLVGHASQCAKTSRLGSVVEVDGDKALPAWMM